jgi:hypothetical protein
MMLLWDLAQSAGWQMCRLRDELRKNTVEAVEDILVGLIDEK